MKNVLNRIIQTTHINSNQEFSIFHNNQYIYTASKEKPEYTNITIKSELNENKTIKELVDSKGIIIHKLFILIFLDDINNIISKVKLKRPQNF